MKVNTDSGMNPNSFRPIPDLAFDFTGIPAVEHRLVNDGIREFVNPRRSQTVDHQRKESSERSISHSILAVYYVPALFPVSTAMLIGVGHQRVQGSIAIVPEIVHDAGFARIEIPRGILH